MANHHPDFDQANDILEYLDSGEIPPFPVQQWELAKTILKLVITKLEKNQPEYSWRTHWECDIQKSDLLSLGANESELMDAIQTLARTRLIDAYEPEQGILSFHLDDCTQDYGVLGYMHRLSKESIRPYLVRQLHRDPNVIEHGCIGCALETVKLKGLSFAAKSVYMLLSTEPDIGGSGLAEWLTKQSVNCTLTQANEIIDELVAFEALKRVHDDWLVFDIEDEVNHD